MKSSEILRKAARGVERGDYYGGCLAIDLESPSRDYLRAHKRYAVVKPDRVPSNGYWWSGRDTRIIGLCLAAAIAESEGD